MAPTQAAGEHPKFVNCIAVSPHLQGNHVRREETRTRYRALGLSVGAGKILTITAFKENRVLTNILDQTSGRRKRKLQHQLFCRTIGRTWHTLVNTLDTRQLSPAIIISSSKYYKRVESGQRGVLTLCTWFRNIWRIAAIINPLQKIRSKDTKFWNYYKLLKSVRRLHKTPITFRKKDISFSKLRWGHTALRATL